MSIQKFFEIQEKGFSINFRGYNSKEVDNYVRELLQYCKTINAEKEKIVEELAAYKEREDYINKAIINAEKLAIEIKNDAEREAHSAKREAKKAADEIIAQANKQIESRMQEMEDIKRDFERVFQQYIQKSNTMSDQFFVVAERHIAALKEDYIGEIHDTMDVLSHKFKEVYEKGRFTVEANTIKESENNEQQKKEVIGKVIYKDINDEKGNLIIAGGTILTAELLKWAKMKGFYNQVAAAAANEK